MCKPRVCRSNGVFFISQAYGFYHPWIALGASPPILVKILQNTVSPISFLWGDISSDKQIDFLMHIILKQNIS